MEISSSEFENGKRIPDKYTCEGEDVNPSLEISGVPEKTQSLALILDDPDSPGKTWVHWLVWNIDPSIKKIEEGSVPGGAIQGTTDFGKTQYGGPCPHGGTHRYFFRLFALDEKLDLVQGSSRDELEKSMEGHIIEKAELSGMYSR